MNRTSIVDYVAGLRFAAARSQLQTDGWPRYLVNEIELEYRRYLVLRMLRPDVELRLGPLIGLFATAADDDAGIVTAADSKTISLYRREFPDATGSYWRVRSLEELGVRTSTRRVLNGHG